MRICVFSISYGKTSREGIRDEGCRYDRFNVCPHVAPVGTAPSVAVVDEALQGFQVCFECLSTSRS